MNELPPNELPTGPEPIKTSITGASFLGEKFKTDIALAKLKIELASAQITTAVQDIHAAGDHGLKLAKTLQAEADDLKAAFGQTSNGGPN